jgi:hypothetical protein
MWVLALQDMWIHEEVPLVCIRDFRWSSVMAKPYADISGTIKHESREKAASAATQEAMWLNRLLPQLAFELQDQQCYMKITRQLFYLLIILVITVEASTFILVVFCS